MFYDNFDKLCTKIGTSPTNFTKNVLGLSTSKVTAWKNGSIPKYEILQKIADVFNVSVGDLFDGEQEPEENKNAAPENRDGIDEPVISKMSESEWKAILYQMNETEIDELLNYARYLRWKHSQVL